MFLDLYFNSHVKGIGLLDILYLIKRLTRCHIKCCCYLMDLRVALEIVREYDQEIPQSQTADNPVAPRGRAAQPSRDTRKTN